MKDITLSATGDLEIIEKLDEEDNVLKDFSLISNVDEASQLINTRLKTNLKEFFLHPNIGNGLVNIIGKRNTRETAEIGKTYIIDSIIKENYIQPKDIEISYMPTDERTLIYIIKILIDNFNYVSVVLEVDLQEGIRRVL